MRDKRLIVAAVVLVAATWWLATDPTSPIRPKPPRPDRPVLKFLVNVARVAARVGLSVLMFAEPAPQDADEVQLAHSHMGADGYVALDNSRW